MKIFELHTYILTRVKDTLLTQVKVTFTYQITSDLQLYIFIQQHMYN